MDDKKTESEALQSTGEFHFVDYEALWKPAGDALERLALALRIPHGKEVIGDASISIGGTTVRTADLLNALAQFIENHE